MNRIIKVKDGKGNIFKINENLLEGKLGMITESEIKNLGHPIGFG